MPENGQGGIGDAILACFSLAGQQVFVAIDQTILILVQIAPGLREGDQDRVGIGVPLSAQCQAKLEHSAQESVEIELDRIVHKVGARVKKGNHRSPTTFQLQLRLCSGNKVDNPLQGYPPVGSRKSLGKVGGAVGYANLAA